MHLIQNYQLSLNITITTGSRPLPLAGVRLARVVSRPRGRPIDGCGDDERRCHCHRAMPSARCHSSTALQRMTLQRRIIRRLRLQSEFSWASRGQSRIFVGILGDLDPRRQTETGLRLASPPQSSDMPPTRSRYLPFSW